VGNNPASPSTSSESEGEEEDGSIFTHASLAHSRQYLSGRAD